MEKHQHSRKWARQWTFSVGIDVSSEVERMMNYINQWPTRRKSMGLAVQQNLMRISDCMNHWWWKEPCPVLSATHENETFRRKMSIQNWKMHPLAWQRTQLPSNVLQWLLSEATVMHDIWGCSTFSATSPPLSKTCFPTYTFTHACSPHSHMEQLMADFRVVQNAFKNYQQRKSAAVSYITWQTLHLCT